MEIRFAPLVSVVLHHTYSRSGRAEGLAIHPTAGCRRFLERYGLRWRPTAEGFAVFYEEAPGTPGRPLRPLDDSLHLSFALTGRNPFFTNYTELPLDQGSDRIYRLHNLQSTIHDGTLLLSADQADPYVSGLDALPRRPARFRFVAPFGGDQARLSIRDEEGAIRAAATVAAHDGSIDWPVDLGDRPAGRFTIEINGSEALACYVDDELADEAALGVIDLYNDSRVPAAYRFVAANGLVQAKRYAVRFAARQTIWKYLVVCRYRTDLKPEKLSIASSDPAVSFAREPARAMADGTVAVPFVASGPLPLAERPSPGITLDTGHGQGGGGFTVDHLPGAAVTGLVPDPAENKTYSEIFVYV